MSQLVTVDPDHPTPLYAQLEHGLRGAIATGRLRPGDQLPTVRQLAVDLRVNANTVARVYTDLERAGLVETRRGIGTFVAAGSAGIRRGTNADLAVLVRRWVDEAAARGFSIADIRKHLGQLE